MAGEMILVVDDNPVNLKLARALLTRAAYEVRAATAADEALKVLETVRPSLILMDIQLPGMDGLALTRLLKADPRYQDIPIVALTAYAMKGDEERMIASGCDGYISKPIDTTRFAAMVTRYLPDKLE